MPGWSTAASASASSSLVLIRNQTNTYYLMNLENVTNSLNLAGASSCTARRNKPCPKALSCVRRGWAVKRLSFCTHVRFTRPRFVSEVHDPLWAGGRHLP